MAEHHTLAILRFRSIGGPEAENWLTSSALAETRLDEMLSWLHRGSWRGVTADEVARAVENPGSLPERAVLLTFDGGCRSVLERALPILRKYRFPAVAFVATGFVGREVTFDALEESMTVSSWDELVMLDRNDVSIQSLGVGRRRFSRLDTAGQEREAAASREAIETHIGRAPEIFAYPHGDPGRDPQDAARILQRAGYCAACALGGGLNTLPGADSYRLSRIEVGMGTDLAAALGG